MWPFKQKRQLRAIEQHESERTGVALTDEEKTAVLKTFASLKSYVEGDEGGGDVYMDTDASNAMISFGLVNYAQNQVLHAYFDDKAIVDKQMCLRKALAATSKAYSIHNLPIYVFDTACLLEMLGDTHGAHLAFSSFLERQEAFKITDLDRAVIKHRDIETAVREARLRIGT